MRKCGFDTTDANCRRFAHCDCASDEALLEHTVTSSRQTRGNALHSVCAWITCRRGMQRDARRITVRSRVQRELEGIWYEALQRMIT